MASDSFLFWQGWAREWLADGIGHAVVCPGSRSSPLLQAMIQAGWQLFSCVDERSAGYQALGMAQALGRPVAVLTTSGTAAANLAPAMAEAYFSRVPIIAITADRPPEWIEQEDNQAIHQIGLFGKHAKGSFNFPCLDGSPIVDWHVARLAREARQALRTWPLGPVHLNVPLREPLYTHPNEASPDAIRPWSPMQLPDLDTQDWSWVQRPLLLHGQHGMSVPEWSDVELGELLSCASLRFPAEAWLPFFDVHAELRPDLVITTGGAFVSKTLRTTLREWDFVHAHLGLPTAEVFMRPVAPISALPTLSESWRETLRAVRGSAQTRVREFWKSTSSFEFQVVQCVIQNLSEPDQIHLGNSLAVRIASFLDVDKPRLRAWCNRGTSGIDGSLSTAVGHAIAVPDVRHVVVLGDLSFFYDRNALWRSTLPTNLTIVVLNNGEGAIFRALDGPSGWGDALSLWTTPHQRTARWAAEENGLHYRAVHNVDELTAALIEPEKSAAVLIEAFTDSTETAETFRSALHHFRHTNPS